MILATLYGLAAAGAMLHGIAAVAAVILPLRARPIGPMLMPRIAAGLGAACFVALLFLRGMQYRVAPLTSGVEVLSLFTIMMVLTILPLTIDVRRRSLLLVYLPAVAGISIIAALLAPAELRSPPKADLSSWFLVFHVVSAFLAFAWFFIAVLTSGVYLYQASRLKRRVPLAATQLPSLEQMDATLYVLIRMAYPLFVLTLFIGAYWAWVDRASLGVYWWLSPKIILSLCMVVIYAVAFHGRAAGWLRGPRLASVLVIGVGGLLGSYLLLEILDLANYNFLGGAA